MDLGKSAEIMATLYNKLYAETHGIRPAVGGFVQAELLTQEGNGYDADFPGNFRADASICRHCGRTVEYRDLDFEHKCGKCRKEEVKLAMKRSYCDETAEAIAECNECQGPCDCCPYNDSTDEATSDNIDHQTAQVIRRG